MDNTMKMRMREGKFMALIIFRLIWFSVIRNSDLYGLFDDRISLDIRWDPQPSAVPEPLYVQMKNLA